MKVVAETLHPFQRPYASGAGSWTILVCRQGNTSSQEVGSSRQAYDRLAKALSAWEHMDLGWCMTNQPQIQQGSLVCIAAKTFFMWSQNPLRIVYAETEQPSKQFEGRQLVYGQSTLYGHQLAGEERFSLEWHAADDSVWYDVLTFSRAASALAIITYPLVRHQQRRFQSESTKKLRALASKASL